MHKAVLKIEFGKNAKEYLEVVGKGRKGSKGSVRITGKGGIITVEASADDPKALLASLNSTLKQFRIISGVDASISEET